MYNRQDMPDFRLYAVFYFTPVLSRSKCETAATLQKHIRTTPTDNGFEFAAYKLIIEYLGVLIYFADPYASWQRGAIENTNKLIR